MVISSKYQNNLLLLTVNHHLCILPLRFLILMHSCLKYVFIWSIVKKNGKL